jgi:hypothetical protein
LSLQVQENILLEDLLFVLMGIEGKYIKVNLVPIKTALGREEGSIAFQVDSSLGLVSSVA